MQIEFLIVHAERYPALFAQQKPVLFQMHDPMVSPYIRSIYLIEL